MLDSREHSTASDAGQARARGRATRWARGFALGAGVIVLYLAALFVVAHHMICPEVKTGTIGSERLCMSFGWTALNYGAVTLMFAVVIVLVPRLSRATRLALMGILVVLFCLLLGGATHDASDMVSPMTADKVEWDFPHEGKRAWGFTLVTASLLALAASRRRGS